jgi:hypothetical protein
MRCIDGLRFVPLFSDGTGECTDESKLVEELSSMNTHGRKT